MQALPRSAFHARRRGLAFVACAGVLWSSSGLFIKVLPLTAWQIAAWRSLVAGLTILVLAALFRVRIRLVPDRLNLLGACAYAGVLVLFVVATKLTTAANAIFLQFTAPIYLLVLEPWALGTRFRRRDLWAVLACLGGMGLFFVGRLGPGHLLGNLLALASGACLACFSLLLKRRSLAHPGESPVGVVVVGNAAVFLLCLPMLLLGRGPVPTPAHAGALLFLGVVQLGLAYFLFAQGMRSVSATAAGITSMLEAVFNPVWVFLGTGERPGPYALLGGCIILGVVLLYSLVDAGEHGLELGPGA